MSVVVASIDIAASAQEVWDLVMDPTRIREWVTMVHSIDHVDAGPLRTGLRMDQTLSLFGVRFKVHWTLATCRPPTYARWEGVGPARSNAVTENRISQRDGVTRLDYRNEFHTPLGPLGTVASKAFVGAIPEREANASLRRLKQILERRP